MFEEDGGGFCGVDLHSPLASPCGDLVEEGLQGPGG